GKFGEGKRRFGLNRIYTMLRETSETVIALKFLVMNLERRLRVSLRFFYLLANKCSFQTKFPTLFDQIVL
ncbi:MAG: transposase, partial [Sporolactobacillus sp.]